MTTLISEPPRVAAAAGTRTADMRLMLVGNPNVGKSVIFGYLTGKYVTVSNYPGTTVEVSRGRMRYGGKDVEVIDTPGVDSLVPQSEDECVTRDMLLKARPDVIVQVADAKNLRRTLLVTAQLAEFGIPMVLVLNLMDEARSRGIEIDVEGISELFDIPVVPAVAIDGEGLNLLFKTIHRARVPKDPLWERRWEVLRQEPLLRPLVEGAAGMPLQSAIEWLQAGDALMRRGAENWLEELPQFEALRDPAHRTRLRALLKRLNEMRGVFLDDTVAKFKTAQPSLLRAEEDNRVLKIAFPFLALGAALFLYTEIGRLLGLPTLYGMLHSWMDQSAIPAMQNWMNGARLGWLSVLLFGNFVQESGAYEGGLVYPALTQFLLLIAPVVVPLAVILRHSRRFAERLGYWTRDWKTGGATLIVVLLLMYEFVGVIGAGTLVDALENNIFNGHVVPWMQAVIPHGLIYDFLVGPYGLVSVGFTYALAIVLPIVATFFIAFGLLEDSGYLPRLAILADRLFRVMGLNGKAVLPMVLGLGCDTMATMTTRILATKKERLIATVLLALGVPCSAQLGVILAIVGSLSPWAMLTIFGVVGSQMLLVGYLSSKLIKGKPGDFIFEIPPIRVPVFKNVWNKTRVRITWYLREALPLFLAGTLILFILDRVRLPIGAGMNGLELIESALSPLVTGILHLPQQTARVLLLGFLRRDYGAAGLFDMVRNGVLSPVQIVVSLIVLTLFIPCIANFFMIIREQGTKKAFMILAFITPFAIGVGAVVSWVLRALRVQF